MVNRQLYQRAIDKWGANLQIDMLMEECAELIAAINRWRRGRTDVAVVAEEIADVEIMLEQMRLLFPEQVIEASKREKLERLADRLEHVDG